MCYWVLTISCQKLLISSCYCCSVAQLCWTLCNLIVCSLQASPSLSPGVCSNSCPLNWWCHPVISFSVTPFSSCPQSSLDSGELALCIRWPKCWSFNFSIIPSTEYSGLTSFRINWFDLFPVQEAFKSSPAPQFESISSSAFSVFYGAGLRSVHDYWKTVALTIRALVGKVMFLLVICCLDLSAFLPRSKRLLISVAAVTIRSDFGAQENKICHCCPFFPLYLPRSAGARCNDLRVWTFEF